MRSKIPHELFFRNAWDFIIVSLTGILAIYLPLKFALGEQLAFYAGLAAVPFAFFAPHGFEAFRLLKLARASKIMERIQVALYFKKEIVERIPMFSQLSQEFIESIALHLDPAVFTPGDYIFRAGEPGQAMYFIIQGRVKVVTPDGATVLSRLSDGDCFGEVSLFLNKPRTATVIAEEYCDLYALSKNTFNEVISRYPGFAQKIESIALARERNRPEE